MLYPPNEYQPVDTCRRGEGHPPPIAPHTRRRGGEGGRPVPSIEDARAPPGGRTERLSLARIGKVDTYEGEKRGAAAQRPPPLLAPVKNNADAAPTVSVMFILTPPVATL